MVLLPAWQCAALLRGLPVVSDLAGQCLRIRMLAAKFATDAGRQDLKVRRFDCCEVPGRMPAKDVGRK
jgi:hypothetical protein